MGKRDTGRQLFTNYLLYFLSGTEVIFDPTIQGMTRYKNYASSKTMKKENIVKNIKNRDHKEAIQSLINTFQQINISETFKKLKFVQHSK